MHFWLTWGRTENSYCVPTEGFTNTGLKLLLKEFWDKHPEFLPEPAASSVWGALYNAFPMQIAGANTGLLCKSGHGWWVRLG